MNQKDKKDYIFLVLEDFEELVHEKTHGVIEFTTLEVKGISELFYSRVWIQGMQYYSMVRMKDYRMGNELQKKDKELIHRKL